MLNRLRVFMAGRNGPDQLAIAAFAVAFVASIFSNIFGGIIVLMFFSMASLGYSTFRILSKNLSKRRGENYRFCNIWWSFKSAVSGWRERRTLSKEYKFFVCHGCKNRLRVPKGKGKIQITCPRCGLRFGGKT
jgi:hypothetical protein